VLDNEAGLENLSRRIVQHVNLMIMVADASARGLKTVLRLHEMTAEMQIRYDKLAIIINRTRGGQMPAGAEELKERTGADFVFCISDNEQIAKYGEDGKSLLEIDDDNEAAVRISNFLKDAGVCNK
jgi:CO dehydrogenase maturation factor